MILAPPKETGRTTHETPTALSTTRNVHPTPVGSKRQRLPAFGRRLRAALEAGYWPMLGGGTIIVTTDWHFARAFDPGRLVCPPDVPAMEWDLRFLAGCHVVVLVPAAHKILGERLTAAIRDAGAAPVVLSVVPEDEP